MISITASQSVVAELGQVGQLAEIRGPDGTLVGYFAPVSTRAELLYQVATMQFDPAEVARRKQLNQHGYSIEEVLSHLQSLDATPCSGQ